jgi:hypothetical protein
VLDRVWRESQQLLGSSQLGGRRSILGWACAGCVGEVRKRGDQGVGDLGTRDPATPQTTNLRVVHFIEGADGGGNGLLDCHVGRSAPGGAVTAHANDIGTTGAIYLMKDLRFSADRSADNSMTPSGLVRDTALLCRDRRTQATDWSDDLDDVVWLRRYLPDPTDVQRRCCRQRLVT